jgi:glyoxylase-like metal-dependent hydrolase (beta-lactamase superfamily II)
MNTIKHHKFNDVNCYELGYGYVGKPYMNTMFYIIDDIIIDTGQSLMKNSFAEIVKDKKISTGLLTHHHEDHSGNVKRLIEMKQITVYGHEITAAKMKSGFKILPYQHLMWGKADKAMISLLPELIETEKYTLTPIHTPGHSKDHTSYYEKNQGWLFSGDLFLGTRIKYFRADEKIHDTIASIKKVLMLDFDSLFCAHNPQPSGGKIKLKQKLDYLEELTGKIELLMSKGLEKKDIIKILRTEYSEVTGIKLFTGFNVSFSNILNSF